MDSFASMSQSYLTRSLALCAIFSAIVTQIAATGTSEGYPDKSLLSALQAVVDEKAEFWNTSFSVGLYSPKIGGSIGVAGGYNDRRTKSKTNTINRFPVGSVTKPFTACAILQLNESGRLDLDESIAKYVDPFLMKWNDTTMLELWGGDTTVLKVTARMLMGMRAGLHDYNDTWYLEETLLHPDVDVTPFDLLHRMNKSWVCPPGTCGEYASTGFEILGLVLAGMAGVDNWLEYDQKSVIPAPLRPYYANTAFPGRGLCGQDPLIVHQYGSIGGKRDLQVNITFQDLIDTSCLNGWTCGNIAASPSDVARFHWDLQHGNIISNESLRQMMNFKNMDVGWNPQKYGLAMMEQWPERGWPWAPDPTNETWTLGHAGADYGSLGYLAGYNTIHGFGIAVFTNSVVGMNCSRPESQMNSYFWYDSACPMYDAILQLVTNATAPRLNCSACPATGACLPVRPPQPPSPTCLPVLESTCGVVKNDRSQCWECYKQHKRAIAAAMCTMDQVKTFCNITSPPSPSPPPTPAVLPNCIFDF